MHYLVKLLVRADNEVSAMERAKQDADEMVRSGIIDYADFNGRWGDSVAHNITSDEGKRLLEEGMTSNRQQIYQALDAVRSMLDRYTNEQIYNEKFPKEDQEDADFYISRYQFSIVAGNSTNSSVYCINPDMWGGRLEKDTDLEHILNNNDNNKLWVVPVDVHN